MKVSARKLALILSMGMLLLQTPVQAETDTSAPASDEVGAQTANADDVAPVSEIQRIFDGARETASVGPAEVALSDQGVLKLEAGKIFIPQPHAAALMRAMGNPGDYSDLAGLVFPQGEEEWFVVVRFENAGYIKDDDARDWDADDMLNSYREGTEAANEERVRMGVTPMEIIGWAEKPTYVQETHRLVWAMRSRDKGAPEGAPEGVNFNTYALGRDGYFSLNLVTGMNQLAADKVHAHNLLQGLAFNEGKRYTDFNAETDRVAEYGLAALVLGAGAKKLGLFAALFAFVAKFAKVFLLGAAAIGAGLMKLRGRKSDTQA